MPEKTTPDKIGAIIEQYEKIFSNIFSGLKDSEELTFSDLLSVITQIKVLPAPSDGRGGFVKPDLVSTNQTSEKENNVRKSIAQTVGMPYFYLTLDDANVSRIESLKIFARYARKLNSIQDCIITGLKELLCIHVYYAEGLKISPDDIKISMREIVNMEILDRMEYLVALMTGLQEIIKLCDGIEQSNSIDIGIDSDVLHGILNKNLEGFQGADNLFIKKDKSVQRQRAVEQSALFTEVKENHERQAKTVINSFIENRNKNL
jgi:hypothetical protein